MARGDASKDIKRAELLLAYRKLKEAEAEAREAIRISPQSLDAWMILGRILSRTKGREMEAIEAFRKAIQSNSEQYKSSEFNVEAYYLIGDTFLRLENYPEAEQAGRNAINNAEVWGYEYVGYSPFLLLGKALYHQDKLEGAVKYLEAARYKKPNNPATRWYLGLAYLKGGLYEEAIKEFELYLNFDIKPALTKYNLACCYSRIGKPKWAIQYLKKAVEKGFADYPLMEKDPDQDNIRNEPEFIKLIEVVKKRWEGKHKK